MSACDLPRSSQQDCGAAGGALIRKLLVRSLDAVGQSEVQKDPLALLFSMWDK